MTNVALQGFLGAVAIVLLYDCLVKPEHCCPEHVYGGGTVLSILHLDNITARRLLASAIVALAILACLSLPAAASRTTPGFGPEVPVVSAGGPRFAQVTGEKTWFFERFDSDVKVNTDGSLTVRETQVANFQGNFTFLNRDLTVSKASFSEGRSYGSVRYSDIKVYDLKGSPYKSFKVENINGGKRVHISFSASFQTMGWIVEYKMKGAVIYAKNYDRLYYNAVSLDRDVAIASSRITVRLPAGTDMSKVKSTEYPDKVSPPGPAQSGRDGTTLWWQVKDIKPQTTFTVDVSFPKGIVSVPLVYRAWFGILMIAIAFLLGAGALVLMIFLWWRKGRDVAAPELDVVRYEPPEDMRPAEVGVLVKEKPLIGDITATIVDLAIRRKLVINDLGEEGILKHRKFGFQRWDPDIDDTAPFEKELLIGLFENGPSVTEDDLKDKFYKHVSTIDKNLTEQVMSKGLFDGEPAKVKAKYTRLAIVLLLLMGGVYLLWRWYDLGYFLVLAGGFAVAAIAVFIVGLYMPRRTVKGSEMLSYVNGFKEYMSTAEREEMKLMTADNFQANLPYAMVLGVAKEWAGKFADIYKEPPEWFRGYPGTTFSAVYLADSLYMMQSNVGTTLTSQPSSSSGGGGGFGGGFSGGGFGGGGSSAG